jgi:hypothetical protein
MTEPPKDGNHIRVATERDHKRVVLTTNVDGIDAAWITMDASQLDSFIRLLLDHRREIS